MNKAVRELSRPPWNIEAIYTPWTEYAWNYGDFPELLRYFREKEWIVLGGDILTPELTHTRDNWYYNPDSSKTRTENIRLSCETAEKYLAMYRDRRGTDFLIVFVVTRRFP